MACSISPVKKTFVTWYIFKEQGIHRNVFMITAKNNITMLERNKNTLFLLTRIAWWKQNDLKIKIAAEQKTESRNPRMIQIGKSFDKINSQKGEYIVNPKSGFQIGLTI